MFCKSNVNKTVYFLVSLKYIDIITVKTVTLYIRNFIFFIKNFKSKKKKLALTLFYYVSREI